MADIQVEKVGGSVTVVQDGVLLIVMSVETALTLGAALFKVAAFGRDSLDEVPSQ